MTKKINKKDQLKQEEQYKQETQKQNDQKHELKQQEYNEEKNHKELEVLTQQQQEKNDPKVEGNNTIVHKKRGRKPKGGKIICSNETIVTKNIVSEPNIILHLKCKKEDLNNLVNVNNITSVKYEPNIQNVENYHFDNSKSGELQYCMISSLENAVLSDEQKLSTISESKINNSIDTHDEHNNKDNLTNIISSNTNSSNIKSDKKHITVTITNNNCNSNNVNVNSIHGISGNIINNNSSISDNNNSIKQDNDEDSYNINDGSTIKSIKKKLKELSIQLHNNDIADKKSACFWCTFDFDNPAIYIPKYELNNTYYCYGCFCSPECATASLFKEPIDISIKFERYHLLNHIYCKIYDYNKNIKPAPDPFYTLDKYYGNLTIQEYRRLLKNNRLILIVDKPIKK